MKRPKLGAAVALACLVTVGGLTALPILVIGVGSASALCDKIGEIADDGTPSILGPSTLTVAELRAWWNSTGRGQPSRLGIAIADLIALYISEGDAEGVRGDLAFAQAVLETGYFTNSDTAINNYAGIAHYDGTASGSAFRDPIIGVRAQIQLLKKYALGNGAPLANPDVVPNGGSIHQYRPRDLVLVRDLETTPPQSLRHPRHDGVRGELLARVDDCQPAIRHGEYGARTACHT